ncbi:MAG: tetratricopeptide repeat protein, partial [Alphaproteobacteria bacterium]
MKGPPAILVRFVGHVAKRCPAVLMSLFLVACAGIDGTDGSGRGVRLAPDGPRVEGLRAYLVAGMAAGEGDPRAADFYLAALADDPDNPRLLRQAFLSLIIAGRMREAAGLQERLTRSGEGGDLARLVAALRDFRNGRAEAASRQLDQLEARGFEQLIRPVIKAWIIAGQGHRDEALRALSPLDSRFGLMNYAKMERAFLLDYFGDVERAAVAYKALVYAKGLTSLQPVMSYAALLQRTGRAQEAKAMLADMRRLYPNNDFLEAISASLTRGERLKPVASKPEGAVALLLFRTAGDLGRQRAWRPAIVYARLAAWLAPRMSDVHLRLGALLSAAGYHRLALRALDRLPSSDPLYPRAQRQKAWVYRQAGEQEKAIAALEQYLVRHPEDDEAW